MNARVVLATVLLVGAPGAVAAQELARRVSAAGDGTVRFAYEVRPGVEICDQGLRMGDHQVQWRGGHEWEPRNCRRGPVEVEVRVRDGQARSIDVVYREGDRTRGATDLGLVPASDAVAWFFAVARGDGSANAAEEAVFPAVIGDVNEVWRPLLELAKDRAVPRDARKSALFWVGQEAADVVTEGLSDVARDEDEDQGVRDAAVFALSQRPPDESVPVLMELARTAEQERTRRSAMFWLAQSGDDRVVAFFQEVLLGRGG